MESLVAADCRLGGRDLGWNPLLRLILLIGRLRPPPFPGGFADGRTLLHPLARRMIVVWAVAPSSIPWRGADCCLGGRALLYSLAQS
jgi:hypothetical protein